MADQVPLSLALCPAVAWVRALTAVRICRPHAFKAVYSVSLHGEKLRTDFRVFNTGKEPFEFTAALHTYFEVADVSQAKVNGLHNLKYLDKVGALWSLSVLLLA